jgi:hypothetical protein
MTNSYNDKTMIVSDTIYHNIECCLRNMVCEDDEAKKQRIATHILRVLRTGQI